MVEDTKESSKFADSIKDPKHMDEDKFDEFLQKLKYSWVQINRDGSDRIEGMLINCFEDHVIVIDETEEVRPIPKSLIRNISPGRANEDDKPTWNRIGIKKDQECKPYPHPLEEQSFLERIPVNICNTSEKVPRFNVTMEKGTNEEVHRIIIEIRFA
ncbi:hypothetical protein DNHGIG_07460 [Collibacillus ludicampi]|uniref:DUF2642 domain-containing protein n=1 Tax=Collibacillus ludicampi TaxID=2771369 RepID=A0AAV4LBN2_9BACL|nr:hypothetical protein [Collibacillus ludicampi]GIM45197.1 hypothetical protein DNHGIG_07460 [Collibacillus ludicampi]